MKRLIDPSPGKAGVKLWPPAVAPGALGRTAWCSGPSLSCRSSLWDRGGERGEPGPWPQADHRSHGASVTSGYQTPAVGHPVTSTCSHMMTWTYEGSGTPLDMPAEKASEHAMTPFEGTELEKQHCLPPSDSCGQCSLPHGLACGTSDLDFMLEHRRDVGGCGPCLPGALHPGPWSWSGYVIALLIWSLSS